MSEKGHEAALRTMIDETFTFRSVLLLISKHEQKSASRRPCEKSETPVFWGRWKDRRSLLGRERLV